ncbi:MAG: hypothetical protein GEU83_20115 [Pseudonocardiaceae bacterium]|nr:hypothetical protein [Pseudonocardiaceae bacterium]
MLATGKPYRQRSDTASTGRRPWPDFSARTTASTLELVGQALDHLRDSAGTAAVDAAIDQADTALADAAIAATEPGHLTDALRDLLVEIRHCQRAGQVSSPELEARFRATATALARPAS